MSVNWGRTHGNIWLTIKKINCPKTVRRIKYAIRISRWGLTLNLELIIIGVKKINYHKSRELMWF
jgi:hypothetical protein